MFKGKRILFYVPGLDVIKGAVYYSQVFGLAQYLVAHGAECLVVESAYNEDDRWEKVIDGVRVLNCPLPKKYVPMPFLYSRFRKTVKPMWNHILNFSPTHIYVRNVHAGLAAFNLKRVTGAKLIYSRRGHEVVEIKAGGRLSDKIRAYIMRIYTSFLMRRVDHVSMVAYTLMEDTVRFCAMTSVLPCCVMNDKFVQISAKERISCRESLGIPIDAKVVIYSGSMGHYQIPEVFLSEMKRIHELDRNIVFLILTEMLDVFNRKVEEVGLPKECYRVRKCIPQEVSVYLQSADVGLILRKNDDINRHASPVKIAEYLASGLGLIISPWIGDVGGALANHDFAFLHTQQSTAEDMVTFIRTLTDEQREHARRFAHDYYTYEGNRDALVSMFS